MTDFDPSMTSGRVTSRDGTPIGYLKTGRGPAVVILHGSMESARSHTLLAQALAGDFTVYLPDRRGPWHVRPAPARPQRADRGGRPAGRPGRIGCAAGLRGQRRRPGRPGGRPHPARHPQDRRLRARAGHGRHQEHRLAEALRPRDGQRQGGGRDDHQHVRAGTGAAVLQDHAAPPAGLPHRDGHEEGGQEGRPGRHHDAQAGAHHPLRGRAHRRDGRHRADAFRASPPTS